MKTYCILKKKDDVNIIAVQTGFSILAFIIGPFWAFFRNLWLYSAMGFIFLLGFRIILQTFALYNIFFIVAIISSFFWGVFARDLLIQNLINRKFEPISQVVASSKESAIIKYLSEESL